MSHSRKDKEIVNNTFKLCQRTKIKSNIAEFEEIEKGQLSVEKIRDMIDRSDLFFLFLSENVKSIYTQNWISFELGCTYAQKKMKKKFIYVFEPFTQLHFPIPYLDYYILYHPNHDPDWKFIEEVMAQEREFSDVIRSLNPITQAFIMVYRLRERLMGRKVQRPSEYRGFEIYHNDCGAKYFLLSKPNQWLCPKCRKMTNWKPLMRKCAHEQI